MDVTAYLVAAAVAQMARVVAQMARDDAATAAFATLDAANQAALDEAAEFLDAGTPPLASLTPEEQATVRRVPDGALGSDVPGVCSAIVSHRLSFTAAGSGPSDLAERAEDYLRASAGRP